mmetsp:Transcript_12316/g.42706  ORF Transcript_12316/g.42706 Transcript_12316/m.42706 type:complete len:288 (+) Transcript_12316:3565-4428(+)
MPTGGADGDGPPVPYSVSGVRSAESHARGERAWHSRLPDARGAERCRQGAAAAVPEATRRQAVQGDARSDREDNQCVHPGGGGTSTRELCAERRHSGTKVRAQTCSGRAAAGACGDSFSASVAPLQVRARHISALRKLWREVHDSRRDQCTQGAEVLRFGRPLLPADMQGWQRRPSAGRCDDATFCPSQHASARVRGHKNAPAAHGTIQGRAFYASCRPCGVDRGHCPFKRVAGLFGWRWGTRALQAERRFTQHVFQQNEIGVSSGQARGLRPGVRALQTGDAQLLS